MWTVHQVDPHERAAGGLDTLGARVLASSADVLVAHDDATAAQVHRLPGGPRQVTVVPHGSYIGVYPAGHTRQEMKKSLESPRIHSRSSRSASSAATSPSISCSRRFGRPPFDAALVIAGNAKDPSVADAIRSAAARDPRIRFRSGFVPADGVAELFGACDVAVSARTDGGTSGSLILALSMGSSVIAADAPAYRALAADGHAGWLFVPGDVESLKSALEAAAGDGTAAGAGPLRCVALGLDWSVTASRLAALLRAAP